MSGLEPKKVLFYLTWVATLTIVIAQTITVARTSRKRRQGI
jgi:hypothetical protein